MSDSFGFAQNIAWVIGINRYTGGIPELSTAVNDAQTIAQTLRDLHGYQVHTLIDQQASLDSIQSFLAQDLVQTLGHRDRLLFYFAGHGIALNGDDGPEGYLIPQDATLGVVQTYLPMTWLQDALSALSCHHFLGVLDCCFAGAFRWSSTRDLAYVPEVIHQERYERFLLDPAWQIITSADYDQKALDAFSLETSRGNVGVHSPFAQAFIDALGGAADIFPPAKSGQIQGDGLITATELYLCLREQVESSDALSSHRQTPGLWPLRKHNKGEYLFFTPNHPLNLPPSPKLDDSRNPYRGLKSFDEADQDLFFGRADLIKELYNFVEAHPLTVVLGPSGSGKSSLVKAGLIPAIKEWLATGEIEGTVIGPIRPGESPRKALLQMLRSHPTTLSNQERMDSLIAYLQQRSHSSLPNKVYLIIDQFEEIITLCSSALERQRFFKDLTDALTRYSPHLRLILTLRSDYEPHLQDSTFQSFWSEARFIVPAMSRQSLRAAIEEPASSRVMYFEPSQIVDQLIDEVVLMPGALPLLSFTLSELYFQYLRNVRAGLTDNRAITQADYDALGGVTRSLTQRADAEYQALLAEDPDYALTIRRVLLRMVAVGSGELARRRVLLSELQYDGHEGHRVQTVIQRLTQARLLVEGQDSGGNPYVEPAHDALVRGWKRLLQWQKEADERLVLQRRLTPAAQEWRRDRRNKLLWNADPRLELLKDISNTERAWFNPVEDEFVQKSLGLKRRNVIGRWAIAISVMLGLGSLALIAVLNQRNSLIEQIKASKKSAEVNLLSAPTALESFSESINAARLFKQPLLAFFPPTGPLKQQLQGTLLSSFYEMRERVRMALPPGITRGRFSPDGNTIAIASENGTVSLWSLGGEQRQSWLADSIRVNRVVWSPKGEHILTGGEDGNVKIWTHQGELLKTLKVSQSAVISLAISPNGQYLAGVARDGRIRLWSGNGALIKAWDAHQGSIRTVHFSPNSRWMVTAGEDDKTKIWSNQGQLQQSFDNPAWEVIFSPDSQTLASAGDDGSYSLWSLEGKRLGRWQADSERLWAIAFRPDGQQIATSGEDGVVRLWTLKGDLRQAFQGHIGPARSVNYTPDSQTVLSSGDDGTTRLWETQDRSSIQFTLPSGRMSAVAISSRNQLATAAKKGTIQFWSSSGERVQTEWSNPPRSSSISMLKFSPQGTTMAIASKNGSLELWDGQDSILLSGHQGAVNGVDFSQEGQSLVSAGADGTLRVWASDGSLIRQLIGHREGARGVSFSPDQEFFASVGVDGNVKLWSVEGKLIHEYQGHIGPVGSVAFHPQGDAIASAGADGTIRLWSVTEKRPLALFRVYGQSAESVAFSPDGEWVASSDSGGGVQLWNWQQKIKFASWRGHEGKKTQVHFSPDGQSLVTLGEEGIVKQWQIHSFERLLQELPRSPVIAERE